MTTSTPNLGLILYDLTTDATTTTFSSFRDVIAGIETTSNFYKIDTAIGTLTTSVSSFSTTATSGGTTTLTSSSFNIQEFTGSASQTIVLPVVSTLSLGRQFLILNNSSSSLTINSSGGNLVLLIPPSTSVSVTCVLITGTSSSSWDVRGLVLKDNSFMLVDNLDNTKTMNFQLSSLDTSTNAVWNFPSGISGTFVGESNTQTLTNKTLTLPVIASIVNTGTLTLPTSTDTLVGRATTDTLTNKRINPRVGTEASSATSTPTADTVDQWNITALAVADSFAAPTGTPTNGQKLIIRIKDNGTARALTWNAIYRGVGAALPTTTVINKTQYLGFIYNSSDSKWDCVSNALEA